MVSDVEFVFVHRALCSWCCFNLACYLVKTYYSSISVYTQRDVCLSVANLLSGDYLSLLIISSLFTVDDELSIFDLVVDFISYSILIIVPILLIPCLIMKICTGLPVSGLVTRVTTIWILRSLISHRD